MITKQAIKANEETKEISKYILNKEPHISRNQLLNKIRNINGKASLSIISRIYIKHRRGL